jgi:DNA modification methylase
VASTKAPSHWKNRLVGEGDEAPAQLLANPLNWRVHPALQQEAVAEALDRVGWIQRVVVNQTTGHVIDGHLRVALAISKGEPLVPVSYVRLSPEEERLALATFDPLGSLAVADHDLLKGLLAEVQPYVEEGALATLLADLARGDLIAVGDTPDLNDLLEGEEKAPRPDLSQEQGERLDALGREVTDQEPDRLAELRQRWGTAEGQTWVIPSGRTPGKEHVLVIGDACDPAVANPLAEQLPRGTVLVTSPPYGMGQDYEGQFADQAAPVHKGKGDRGSPDRKGGRPTQDTVKEWHDLIARFVSTWSPIVPIAAINLADHTVAPEPGYSRHTYGDLTLLAQAAGWPLVATRLWHKGPVWGNNAYWLSTYKPVPEYEFVGLFGRLAEFPFKPVSERVPQDEAWRFRSVWEFPSVQSQQLAKGFHPAAFPAELPRRCLLLLTDLGATVVDPFAGSGTTLVAAESLGRLGVAVERDPTFAAMLLERMGRLGLSPRCLNAQRETTSTPPATGP